MVRAEDAVPTRGEWGEWRRYFRGDTHGTTDLVVLAVTLKPGQAPHPPHRHAEEEFMILAEGTGAWTLDGKELPARKGDVLYAAPWAMHGLKNTGDAPLTYYMVKWNNKGVPPPAKPAAERKGGADQPSAIVGAWNNEVRHAVHQSLYQPAQGVRLRTSVVHFKRDGDRLTGYSLTPDHDREGWNKEGRTDFRDVRFADGRLAFEFDVAELHYGAGGRTKSKAWGRVEAELKGDRLIGKWGLFDKESGAELFRGEWEAVRSKDADRK